jgi:Domain of unknown function (DUF222)
MYLATTPAPATTTADPDRLGDEIATLSATLDAATARLLTLLREFDAGGGWANGFRSCAEWLSWRVGLDPGAARERVRVARALGELPQLAAALARGELSYAKVRALTRVATPETESRLLAVGRPGTAAHVERTDCLISRAPETAGGHSFGDRALAVKPVAVSQEVSRCGLPGKCLHELLRGESHGAFDQDRQRFAQAESSPRDHA